MSNVTCVTEWMNK